MKRKILLLLLLFSSFSFALKSPPRFISIDELLVNKTNVNHLVALLNSKDCSNYLIKIPFPPAAESFDCGKHFSLIKAPIFKNDFSRSALTGNVRYALIQIYFQDSVWRSDDSGSTWKETNLTIFLGKLYQKNRERRFQKLRIEKQTADWNKWTYIFFFISGIYLLTTSIIIFLRSKFLCVISFLKTGILLFILLVAFMLTDCYNHYIFERGMMIGPVVGDICGTIVKTPILFLGNLLVLLLLMPNSLILLQVYSKKNFGKFIKIIEIFQLATIFMWLFISSTFLNIVMM